MLEITKTAAVFKRSEFGYTAHSNFIPFEFTNVDTGAIDRTVILPRKEVDNLGWPDQITVTIEVGNTLNV